MTNIGVGYYQRTSDVQVLHATWTTSQLSGKGVGTGVVRGDFSKGFAGQHVVTYFLPDGGNAGTFDLLIEKTGPVYRMTWSHDGQALYKGLGVETPEGLSIGFGKT